MRVGRILFSFALVHVEAPVSVARVSWDENFAFDLLAKKNINLFDVNSFTPCKL